MELSLNTPTSFSLSNTGTWVNPWVSIYSATSEILESRVAEYKFSRLTANFIANIGLLILSTHLRSISNISSEGVIG